MTKIAILGAGMAGAACAYVLNRYGADVKIFDAAPDLGAGASGNDIGLYNPRFSALRTPESDFYTAAFALALNTFESLEDIDWNPCGALHLITDEKRDKRYRQTVENWGWPEEDLRLLDAGQASEHAGIEIRHAALYLARSGYVSPKKLCRRYLQNIELCLGQKITDLAAIEADAVILACGKGLAEFEVLKDLPLRTVRGQISKVTPSARSRTLKTTIGYGGYITPAVNGVHTLGSTFQRWLDHDDIIAQDDQDNISNLAGHLPHIAEGLTVSGHWASVRVTAHDHFPVIGRVPGHDRLFVSAAHGSHGIISTLAGAHVLAALIFDRPQPLSCESIKGLGPDRFFR